MGMFRACADSVIGEHPQRVAMDEPGVGARHTESTFIGARVVEELRVEQVRREGGILVSTTQ